MEDATRRRLFLFGGLAAVAAGWQALPSVFDRWSSGFDFEDLTDPAGFRKIAGGDVSAPLDIFAGLDAGPQRDLSPTVARVQDDFDAALFSDRRRSDAVQIAYFSDFYCPYCRVLSSDLIEVSRDEVVDITWHETPIFGPPSDLAARGALAAAVQGAYVPFHDMLVSRPVVVTPQYLDRMARDLGLDRQRFNDDMASDETQQALDAASVLFSRFAFLGTPGMVVGRTVVQGRISKINLQQLIARERADGHIG